MSSGVAGGLLAALASAAAIVTGTHQQLNVQWMRCRPAGTPMLLRSAPRQIAHSDITRSTCSPHAQARVLRDAFCKRVSAARVRPRQGPSAFGARVAPCHRRSVAPWLTAMAASENSACCAPDDGQSCPWIRHLALCTLHSTTPKANPTANPRVVQYRASHDCYMSTWSPFSSSRDRGAVHVLDWV